MVKGQEITITYLNKMYKIKYDFATILQEQYVETLNL